MKILVTGASGFIGRHLVKALAQEKRAEVFALSRHPAESEDTTAILCDIMDRQAVERAFQRARFDAVVHLAAITEHHAIVEERVKTFDLNLHGTMNLLDCFNRYCEGGLFLYASTGKVYGRTDEMPISEAARTEPQNILGKTKRITEQIIDFFAEPHHQYLICRIFNIYGEHQRRSFVVPAIIDQMGQPFLTLGALNDRRDFLYIDDLISALLAAIRHREGFAAVDYVNIGSGSPACVADILREMESLTGKTFEVRVDQSRLRADETPVEYCTHQKLTGITGWNPVFDLRDGLRKTLQGEGVIVS